MLRKKRLFRSSSNFVISGVAGGVAEYLGVKPSLVRIIFGILAFFGGAGVWIYLIMTLLVPLEEVKNGRGGGRKIMAGWIILTIGVAELLNQIVPIRIRWELVWPMLLILIGIYVAGK